LWISQHVGTAPGYYDETEPRISEVPVKAAHGREISVQESLSPHLADHSKRNSAA
jgi:hypothetical protein